MIAVLDACTIFNLFNLSNDDKYLNYTVSIFDKVQIVPIVIDEVNRNKSVALFSDNSEDFNEFVLKTINKLVNREILDFEKKHTLKSLNQRKGGKEDGEFVSTCCALHISRIVEKEFAENVLNTHFITDDYPAKLEFQDFFDVNQIGKIIDTLDLLTIFYLKGYITKNALLKAFNSLISIYNRKLNNLSGMLKELKKLDTKKSNQLILTEIINRLEVFSANSESRIMGYIESPEFKAYLRKQKFPIKLFSELFNSKNDEKIKYIKRRIEQLENVMEV